MAERESRNWFVFGKIRESEMCVSDCIQKINVSGQAVPGVTRYGPINQNFVCSFVSSLLHIILILASFIAEMKIENCGKKIFSVGKNR